MKLFSPSITKLYVMYFIVLACFALITFLPINNGAFNPYTNTWYDPLPIGIIFFSSYLIACLLSAYIDHIIKIKNFFAPTLMKVLMTTIIIPVIAFLFANNSFLGQWLYSFLFDPSLLKGEQFPKLTNYLLLTDIAVCILFLSYGTARFIEYRLKQLGKQKPKHVV